jgi:hypothetical protein
MLVRAATNGGMHDGLSGYGPSGSSGTGSPSDFGMSDDGDAAAQVRTAARRRRLPMCVLIVSAL